MSRIVLEKYKNRLVNFNGRNQTLCRNKLYSKKAFDLTRLPGDGEASPEKILLSLVKDDEKEHLLLESFLNVKLSKEEKDTINKEYLSKMDTQIIKDNFSTEEIKQLKEGNTPLKSKVLKIIEESVLEGKKANYATLSKSLESLFDEIDGKERETGLYELYIGFPFVEGRLSDGKTVRGPLFLFPSKLQKREGRWYYQNLNKDKIFINKAFLLAYKETTLTDISHIEEEYEEVEEFFGTEESIDDIESFFDWCLKWPELKKISIETKEFSNKIESCPDVKKDHYTKYPLGELVMKNHLLIGQYNIGSNGIFKDIQSMIDTDDYPESITNLIKFDMTPGSGESGEYEVNVKESECHFVTELDSSQEKAVKSSDKFDNLVIYGPPGTGKSQVIANIVSDNLAKGKKVLVVSEKRTALDVVYKRLEKVGLANKIGFVHDQKRDREFVMEKVVASYNEALNQTHKLSSDVDNYSQTIEKKLEELQSLANTLHSKRNCGLSLFNLYNAANSQLDILKEIEYNFNSFSDFNIEKLNSVTDKLVKLQNGMEADRNILKYRKSFADFQNSQIRNLKSLIDKLKKFQEENLSESFKVFLSELKALNPEKIWLNENSISKDLYLNCDEISRKITELQTASFFAIFKKMKLKKELISFVDLNLLTEEKEKIRKILENKNRIENFEKLLKESKSDPEKLYNLTMNSDIPVNSLSEWFNDYQLLLKDISETLKAIPEFFNESLSKEVLDGKNIYSYLESSAADNFEKLIKHDSIKNSLSEKELFLYDKMLITNSANYPELVKNSFYTLWIEDIEDTEKESLRVMSHYGEIQKNVSELIGAKKEITPKHINRYLNERIQKSFTKNRVGTEITYKAIKTDAEKKRKKKTLRNFIGDHRDQLLTLLPCWMMTAEVVSDILPLEKKLFDLVIFDEASQIFIEKSVPSIYRSGKVVVAGDDKQLKPTSIGIKKATEEDEEIELDENEENEFIADDSAEISESLLDLAKKRYRDTMLNYHYRSRYPQLINFSNYAFYDGRLLTAPTRELESSPPIEVIKIENGTWKSYVNIQEVEKVYHLVRELLINKTSDESLGIVTFNKAQMDAVKEYLEEVGNTDPEFRTLYQSEKVRYDGTEDKSLFVKNIENVQGDERDIIIFTTAYAVDPKLGRVPSRFGSLSQDGGENRLNVAISRAKKKIYIITSIEPEDLSVDNSKNNGPKLLKKYLQYARAVSQKNVVEQESILHSLIQKQVENGKEDIFDSPFEEEVCSKLRDKGYTIHTQIGDSGYRIDMGIYDEKSSQYILGIECDGAAYHSSPSARERDIFRQKFLETKGWNIHRIWSRDWWQNSDGEISKIENILKKL